MTAILSKPSDVAAAPVRDAGGDNEVPRDALGRPRIIVCCTKCEGSGKGVSEKTGKPVKCKGSCGPLKADPDLPVGHVRRSYTRTTTYIDVLDDKSNLEAWQMRMVLIGVALDNGLLNDVGALYADQQAAEQSLRELGVRADEEARAELKAAAKAPKDELNRRAQIAKQKAGAEDKADKGTELHALSELRDQGLDLPGGISFEDVLDLDAYTRASEGFEIVHMEKLVVCDELAIGGTPDRVSEWKGDCPLVAPDGTVYEPGAGVRLITDLKTGTVEYGGLKMAMQLAIYSRSELYDHKTGARSPLENIDQKWGIIMNVPAGSGEAALYWADLELGWEAVKIAGSVRRMRSMSKKALVLLERPMV
jgi:hypothetical protein